MQKTAPNPINLLPVATVMLACAAEFDIEEFFNENKDSFFAKVDPDIRKFPKTVEKSPALKIVIADLPEDEMATEEQVVYFTRTTLNYKKGRGKIDLAHVAQICRMKKKEESDEQGEGLLKTNRPNLFFVYSRHDHHSHLYAIDVWKNGNDWHLTISDHMREHKLVPGSWIFFFHFEKGK